MPWPPTISAYDYQRARDRCDELADNIRNALRYDPNFGFTHEDADAINIVIAVAEREEDNG